MTNSTDTPKAPFKRKKVFIEPEYQLKAAVTLAISIIGYSFLIGLIVFLPLYFEMVGAEDYEQKAFIANMVLLLHQRIWPAVLIIAILAGFQSIYITHRTVGPIFKFKNTIKEYMKGNFMKIKIRDRDNFKDMEIVMNDLAEELGRVRDRDAKFHEHLKEGLESISTSLNGKDKDLAEKARQLAGEIGTNPEAFSIPSPPESKV